MVRVYRGLGFRAVGVKGPGFTLQCELGPLPASVAASSITVANAKSLKGFGGSNRTQQDSSLSLSVSNASNPENELQNTMSSAAFSCVWQAPNLRKPANQHHIHILAILHESRKFARIPNRHGRFSKLWSLLGYPKYWPPYRSNLKGTMT